MTQEIPRRADLSSHTNQYKTGLTHVHRRDEDLPVRQQLQRIEVVAEYSCHSTTSVFVGFATSKLTVEDVTWLTPALPG